MKKLLSIFIIMTILILSGCGKATTTTIEDVTTTTESDELSGLNEVDLDYDALMDTYGDASLVSDGVEIEAENNVYTISVSSDKLEYTLSGYFSGRIVIDNANELSSYKGITLYLSNACIVSDDEATIEYLLDDKNIELVSVKETTNYIVNTSSTNYDGHALSSSNNIELRLQKESVLYLYTVHGHTIKADGDVKLTGAGAIYLSSGHDGIHCHDFTTYNSSHFSGTFEISNAISQGIEASTSGGNGTLTITNGTFIINNCESVAKVDSEINISGGELSSTGIWSSAFQRGSSNVLTIIISEGVSVVINDEEITSCEI